MEIAVSRHGLVVAHCQLWMASISQVLDLHGWRRHVQHTIRPCRLASVEVSRQEGASISFVPVYGVDMKKEL